MTQTIRPDFRVGSFGTGDMIVDSIEIDRAGPNSVDIEIDWRTDPPGQVMLFSWVVESGGNRIVDITNSSVPSTTTFTASGISPGENVEIKIEGLGTGGRVADITSEVEAEIGSTGDITGPEVIITGLQVFDNPVNASEVQRVDVTLTNVGTEVKTVFITPEVNGVNVSRVGDPSRSLDPGETDKVITRFKPERFGIGAGRKTFTASIEGDSKSTTFEVETETDSGTGGTGGTGGDNGGGGGSTDPIQRSPNTAVMTVTALKGSVRESSEQTVVAEVLNSGNAPEGIDITLSVDGERVSQKTDNIEAGERTQYRFSFIPSRLGISQGTHEATVESSDSTTSTSFKVVSNVEDDIPTENGGSGNRNIILAGAALGGGIALSQLIGGN